RGRPGSQPWLEPRLRGQRGLAAGPAAHPRRSRHRRLPRRRRGRPGDQPGRAGGGGRGPGNAAHGAQRRPRQGGPRRPRSPGPGLDPAARLSGRGPRRWRPAATVAAWLRAYSDHWDTEVDEAEVRSRLEVLARFCASCQKEPDELVAWLFRQTPEGPRIRLKRRREVMALIDDFEQGHGGRSAG